MLVGPTPSIWFPVLAGGGSGAAGLAGSRTNVLALEFRDLSAVVRDTGTPANAFAGDLNDLLTYTSPSAKWIRGANGLLTSGTTLRTEYDAAGAPLGLRHEGARTNLARYSQAFDDGTWIALSAQTGATADVVTAPDGTTTADKLTVATASTSSFGKYQIISVASSSTNTFSVFIKPSEYIWVAVAINDSGGDHGTWVNASTGALGTTFGTLVSKSIEAFSNGWYRVSITRTAPATSAVPYVAFSNGDKGSGDGRGTFAGTLGQGVYVWGGQLESGATVSSYMPTTSGTVTRAADNITLAQADFPWAAGAGTLEIDGVVTSPSTSGSNFQIVPRSGQTHIQSYLWVPS
jgi:hypothetical protein